MDNKIRISTFNANSLNGQKLELAEFLKDEKIDAILIQETRLKPNAKFKIPGFTTHRTDRAAKGG